MEQAIRTNVNTKPQRNSAFEILRVIAIIFIIAHHFSFHGGFSFAPYDRTALIIVNDIWIDFIGQLGKAGVNLFVLISAFFLVDSSRFKIKKILFILIEMLFFSIVLGIIFFYVFNKEFSITLLKTMLLPFGTSTWWFMTLYLILYFISPFLNLGIKAMNKKMHFIITLTLLIIWSFMPTFFHADYGFSTFGWFFVLYLIASYIRLYDIPIKIKPVLGIILSIIIFVTIYVIRYELIVTYKGENDAVNKIVDWFFLIILNNFFQVIATLLLFVSFKNINIKPIKPINLIASTTLTIYLFHEQPDIRNYLWVNLFKNASWAPSPYLIPYSIGVILSVFAMGVIIGLAYNYSIGLGVNKLLGFFDKKFLYKVDDIFNNEPRRNDN